MFNHHKAKSLAPRHGSFLYAFRRSVGLLVLSVSVLAAAQDQTTQTPSNQSQQSPSQGPENGKPKQDVPAAAGGPTDNIGPYAIPKKRPEDAPPPPPVAPKKVADLPDYSLKVNVPLVNVDVSVLTKNGQFVPGIDLPTQPSIGRLCDGRPTRCERAWVEGRCRSAGAWCRSTSSLIVTSCELPRLIGKSMLSLVMIACDPRKQSSIYMKLRV